MNKLKINKANQEVIESLRKIINDHRKFEDEVIDALSAGMKLSPEQSEILWDYVYNDSYWMVELE